MSRDRPAPPARVLGLAYDIAVLATAGSALFFMFAGSNAGLLFAGSGGAVAAFALGYASLRRRAVALGAGVVRYCRLWVGMTAVSALSLIHGSWQPLMLFALASLTMTLLYASGAWLGSRAPEAGSNR
jgi:hypothetical protein